MVLFSHNTFLKNSVMAYKFVLMITCSRNFGNRRLEEHPMQLYVSQIPDSGPGWELWRE